MAPQHAPDDAACKGGADAPGTSIHPLGVVQQFFTEVDASNVMGALTLYSHRAIAEYSLRVLVAEVSQRVEESRARGGMHRLLAIVRKRIGEEAVVEVRVDLADGSHQREAFQLLRQDNDWHLDGFRPPAVSTADHLREWTD